MKLPFSFAGAFAPSGNSLACTYPGVCGSRAGGMGRAGRAAGAGAWACASAGCKTLARPGNNAMPKRWAIFISTRLCYREGRQLLLLPIPIAAALLEPQFKIRGAGVHHGHDLHVCFRRERQAHGPDLQMNTPASAAVVDAPETRDLRQNRPRPLHQRSANTAWASPARLLFRFRHALKRRKAKASPVYTRKTPPSEAIPARVCPTQP